MASRSRRYTTPQGAEAEFEPGSQGRVLRNLCGIIRKREMDKAEYEASGLRPLGGLLRRGNAGAGR
jgi:hypothetical protein